MSGSIREGVKSHGQLSLQLQVQLSTLMRAISFLPGPNIPMRRLSAFALPLDARDPPRTTNEIMLAARVSDRQTDSFLILTHIFYKHLDVRRSFYRFQLYPTYGSTTFSPLYTNREARLLVCPVSWSKWVVGRINDSCSKSLSSSVQLLCGPYWGTRL